MEYTWVGGGLPFRNFKGLKEIGMKECVKCGIPIKDKPNRLWCRKCGEEVLEELRGEANRPIQYYFKHNLKKGKSKTTI